jgi:predicted permease
MTWLTRLLRRTRLDRELDAELRFHVEEEQARLIADGVGRDEARRQALAAFGGLQPIAEMARDVRGLRWLEHLGQDARHALRMMRRQPGFTLAAVLSLAVGIGANAAIFNVADALLLRTLPVERPGELRFLARVLPDEEHMRFSHPSYERIAAGVAAASFAAMSSTAPMQITSDRGVEVATGQLVSGNWFQVLGVRPAAGRALGPADAAGPDGQPVAVLGHAYWQRTFASNPAIVGSTLRVNGMPLTVAGIAPAGFFGVTVGSTVDIWMPLPLQHALQYRSNAAVDDADDAKPWLPQEGITWLTVIMRAPDHGADAALARVRDLHRADVERGAARAGNRERAEYARRERLELRPAAHGLSSLRDRYAAPLYVLMSAAAMVLLIGCANLASLLLARGAARAREFGVRLSLGASRARVVRQLLTESLVLGLAGGACGLFVARWGGDMLLRLASSGGGGIPLELPLDWRLLGFTVAVSLAAALAFGLLPALKLARGGLTSTVHAGTRLTAGERRGRVPFGRALVVAQVALSITLLVGAMLFLRTFRNLLSIETGFDDAEILAARIEPRLAGLTEDQLPDLYERLRTHMRHVPGARGAAVAAAGALSGWQRISGIVVDGQPQRVGNDGSVREDFVDAGYFDTLGLSLVAGRGFTERDDARAPRIAVANEAMARKFFGDQNPVGQRFGYGAPADVEIVGVLRDARLDGLRRPSPPMVFYPLSQQMQYAAMVYLRVGAGSADAAIDGLRRAIGAAEPTLAVREITTLRQLNARTVSRERLLAQLTAAFGVLALAVACLGVYGSLSYSVVRRTKELGVRLALGAVPSRLRWQVLRETLTLMALGAVAGVIAAAVAATWIGSLLYGLSPHDPAAFAVAVGALLLVGGLAGAIPAWRASRVNPLIALRAE